MSKKHILGCVVLSVASLLVSDAGLAASGIEHYESTGHTETDACDKALDNAERAAKIAIIGADGGVTGKSCECREHAATFSGDTWSCVGMVKWERR